MSESPSSAQQLNVLGNPLAPCSTEPMTGFFRSGCCETCAEDVGQHTVCTRVTAEFLEFSRSRGNDLITPRPEFGFPGLRPGDGWCVCLGRWIEALQAGCAPPVSLAATHESVLDVLSLETLQANAMG